MFISLHGLREFSGLFTDTYEHIRFSYSVFHFLVLVPCGRLLRSVMSAFEHALKWHLVSYRIAKIICNNKQYKMGHDRQIINW